MFSIFKKKKIVPHVRLTGVIGSAGRFNKGIDLAGQREILKKAFSLKKITHVAISINSPGSTLNASQSLCRVSMFVTALCPGDSIISLKSRGSLPEDSEAIFMS